MEVTNLAADIARRQNELATLSALAHQQHEFMAQANRRKVAAEIDSTRVNAEVALHTLLSRYVEPRKMTEATYV
jgi:hypothetical protein